MWRLTATAVACASFLAPPPAAGLRYFAARKIGMHVGIGAARGPGDTHYYVTFGSAWN